MESTNASRLRKQPENEVVVSLAPHRDREEHVVIADVISLAMRKIWIAPAIALGVAMISWFLSLLVTPVYESSAIFRLGTVLVNQRGLATVEPVDQVYKRIGFKSSVTVKSDDGRMFIVSARGLSPAMAHESAMRVVEETLAMHTAVFEKTRAVNLRAVDDLRVLLHMERGDFDKRKKIIDSLYELETALALAESTKVIVPPTLPTEPVRPHTGRNVVLGFVVGLFIGLIVSFLYGYVKYAIAGNSQPAFPPQ